MDTVAYWNSRAALGPAAGTGDLIAAELERRYIAKYVKDGMSVLDVGCGTGETLRWLADTCGIHGTGLDSSPEMIARANADNVTNVGNIRWNLYFTVADVRTVDIGARFDLIYSQRAIINCGSWEQQSAAIRRILSWLKPNGLYLAVECSADGLSETNALRAAVDLPAIEPPSHNRYLHDQEMREIGGCLWEDGVAWLADIESVCPTYSLLSRVLNARLAADAGEEPRYDSAINQLALRLPNIGWQGQNRCWVWRRCP